MNVHSLMSEDSIMKTTDKRNDVMQAALELIAENGFHGAPMSEIAKKAGVAAGTIYCYFENKDVLINELHQKLEEKISVTVQQGYTVEQPLQERFLYMLRELFRYFIMNPLHFRYMEQYFNSPYGVSRHRDMLLGKSGKHDILMDIFEQGIKRRIFKEFPKAVLFNLALGPLIPLMRDQALGFVTLDDPMIERITEACWDAIKR
jgi:TetR/AcrR family transcriptional regulator, repressor of fatR-cypB operon